MGSLSGLTRSHPLLTTSLELKALPKKQKNFMTRHPVLTTLALSGIAAFAYKLTQVTSLDAYLLKNPALKTVLCNDKELENKGYVQNLDTCSIHKQDDAWLKAHIADTLKWGANIHDSWGELSALYANKTFKRSDFDVILPENITASVEFLKLFDPYSYTLGVSYENGIGAEQNAKAAFDIYLRAAQNDHTNAPYALARCYEKGLGVERNIEKALFWLKEAAQNHHTEATLVLGELYEQGKGVEKDLAKAFYYYEIAVRFSESSYSDKKYGLYYKYPNEEWQPRARANLARCYENGIGIEQNLEKAVQWYIAAALYEDSSKSQHELYQEVIKLHPHLDNKDEWYRLAALARPGSKEAYERLAIIEDGLIRNGLCTRGKINNLPYLHFADTNYICIANMLNWYHTGQIPAVPEYSLGEPIQQYCWSWHYPAEGCLNKE